MPVLLTAVFSRALTLVDLVTTVMVDPLFPVGIEDIQSGLSHGQLVCLVRGDTFIRIQWCTDYRSCFMSFPTPAMLAYPLASLCTATG